MVSRQVKSADRQLRAGVTALDVPKALRDEVADFLAVLQGDHDEDNLYQIIETRLGFLKSVTRNVEAQFRSDNARLAYLRNWFRQQTDAVFSKSNLMHRARAWPEGYPGDYLTLEAIYANQPQGEGVSGLLDRYFLSRTLAVAVRSRLRTLCRLLSERSTAEPAGARWLNLAAGSCRELLYTPPALIAQRQILCIDYDTKALDYAKRLLAERTGDAITFRTDNAFRMANAKRNVERHGKFTTIYSAGLFDYVKSEPLTRLVAGLYGSLAEDGVLIAPFKDATRYETFDYHWLVNWHFFLQRSEDDIHRVFSEAGVPRERIAVTRDPSGVILFFVATK